MSVATIPFGTSINFNSKLTLPSAFSQIAIQATSDYAIVSYIAKIKFNATSMSYNDGNADYTVYSVGKWASTDAQSIIAADDYEIKSETEKQWWLNNTDLTENKIITKTIKGETRMKETITLNRPNWLGSEVGLVRKTITVTQSSGTYVTENGRKILKSGTQITLSNMGDAHYGLLWNDADVTDTDGKIASVMIAGWYIQSALPYSVDVADLKEQGLYDIEYPKTVIAYGEVAD